MNRVEFYVEGKPAPQGSKRHVGNGVLVESAKALKPWRYKVAVAAHQAMLAAGYQPFEGPVTLLAQFVLYRPVSAPKTRVLAATKQPDADKLLRAIGDSLSNVCYRDDAQVVDIRGTKRVALHDEQPGVQITVTEGP